MTHFIELSETGVVSMRDLAFEGRRHFLPLDGFVVGHGENFGNGFRQVLAHVGVHAKRSAVKPRGTADSGDEWRAVTRQGGASQG